MPGRSGHAPAGSAPMATRCAFAATCRRRATVPRVPAPPSAPKRWMSSPRRTALPRPNPWSWCSRARPSAGSAWREISRPRATHSNPRSRSAMSATDPRHAGWLLAALLLAAAPAALARQSDRNHPMDIEAGQAETSLDDSAPTILSGGVTITQGTLHAEANRAEVTVRGGEPSRVVLIGGPATLRQQMDDGTPMNAVAARMDYDVTREVMVFTGNVRIEQPRGILSG